MVAPPVETSRLPAETAARPVEISAPPVKTPALLVETSASPAKMSSLPAETSAPAKTFPQPVETSAPSTKENRVENQPLSPAESTITKLSVHDNVGKILPTPTPKVISKWPPQKTITQKDLQFQIPSIYPHTKTWFNIRTPRLFILLPSTAAAAARFCPPSDPHQQTSPNQLRLYFFCDCYDGHLRHEKAHWVHLSQHVGYRIARPTVFLKELGAYVLAVMEAVRKGLVQGSESNCTPAAKLAQELNELEKEEIRLWKSKRPSSARTNEHIYTEDSVAAMLDEMIVYLKDLAQKTPKAWRKTGKLDKSSWKEWKGMWLHIDTELKKSISTPDPNSHLFGNLHQCLSKSGHCQLICGKHAQLHHQDERLPTGIRGAGHMSLLNLDLPSPMHARTLYEMLVLAKSVHELHVSFSWDVSMTDLRNFSDAVLQSTVVVVRLTLAVPEANTVFVAAGVGLRIPMDDDRARRHASLLGMLAKSKLETFCVNGLPDLFWATRELRATKSFPSLRVMDSKETSIDSQILKKCSALKILKMGYNDILYLALSEKLDFISACPTLEVIEMYFTPDEHAMYLAPAGQHVKQLFQFMESLLKLKTTRESRTRFGLTTLRIYFLEGGYLILDFVTDDDGACSPRIAISQGTGEGRCLQPILADLVKKYGWAIQELRIETSWDPLNVRAWLKSIEDKVGKDGVTNLETLELPRCPLYFNEMVPLRRILERSPSLQLLTVPITCAGVDKWRPETSRQDYLKWIVQYLGPWLTYLDLHDCIGWDAESKLPKLLHKSSLPKLEYLHVTFVENLENDFVWLIDVISSHASSSTDAAAAAVPSFDSYPLSSIVFNKMNSKVESRDLWKKLLGAIDFSVLRNLVIFDSAAFGEEQWNMLLGFLPMDGVWPDGTLVSLKEVFLRGTSLAVNTLDSRLDQLLKRAPLSQLSMIPSKKET